MEENTKSDKLMKEIDRIIKEVWLRNITRDYSARFLLKGDTLKNALYFHLRSALQKLLKKNNLRIYTEFHHQGYIVDLAIVQISDYNSFVHLQDQVEKVLAVIEVKYKNGGNETPFNHDIKKVLNLIEADSPEIPQYYLAFIHEAFYEYTEEPWLSWEQQKWAKGNVTELSGYFLQKSTNMKWQIVTYNNLNPYYLIAPITRESLLEASADFDSKKYSEELYNQYLEVIKNASCVTEKLREAVKYLMYWKLGKVAPIVENGRTSYKISNTTSINKKAVEKTLTDTLLEYGLYFRDKMISYDDFKQVAKSITKTSIAFPVFFIHIWNPVEYPILDVNVWRAYKWDKGETIYEHTKPQTWQNYEEYRTFFMNLTTMTGLDSRMVDKGLWRIGSVF